ncbi:hypothetical protein LVD15_00830 [Fulvivirga maritima]|uniref:hypothetical protein n=1 Tax=Fulvivirga maritima TaxID=2904247 RepID=UPI001F3A3998|nr:hypothetical protein [Fulvivirga maritima]UII27013.1 hypothetical protein LVD15_00830 [Fulvivirga maritima]
MTTKVKTDHLKHLSKFLRQNKNLDWAKTNLTNPQQIQTLNWKGLEESQEKTLKEIKAYQRLVRVLGENDPKTIKALLMANIHSAIQIAAMPKKAFKKKCFAIFKKNDARMEEVYKKATSIRSQLLLLYMNKLQQAEPHANQVKSLEGK